MEREKAGVEESPLPPVLLEEPTTGRTDAQKEETARRLRPHSRPSQIKLDEASRRPQGLTPVNPPKKTKPVRWQFGIRSRNSPWEALLCIHKALHKLGATYLPDEDFESLHGQEREGTVSGDGSFVDDYNDGPQRGSDSSSSIDPLKIYKLPGDPWHINVRWEAKGNISATQPSHLVITNDIQPFASVQPKTRPKT
jgi:carbon catabolite-derepressing protein kinase